MMPHSIVELVWKIRASPTDEREASKGRAVIQLLNLKSSLEKVSELQFIMEKKAIINATLAISQEQRRKAERGKDQNNKEKCQKMYLPK